MINVSISLVGIVVTIVLFLLAHVGTLVWFMSRINALVDFLGRDLDRLARSLDRLEAERYTVRDATKDWEHHKEEHKTLWQKYDRLEGRLNETGGPK